MSGVSQARPAMGRDATPVRVMHVVHALRYGGMELGVVKLVNALESAAVTSAICSCAAADEVRQRLLPSIRLVELDRREGNDWRLVARLARTFRAWRPDIVHTHAWGTLVEGTVAARLAGVPRVVHGEHGTLQTGWRQRIAQRLVWRQVDQVLAVSSELRERIRTVVGFERVHTIHNGVDLSRFGRGDRVRGRLAIGAAADEIVVGTVGRLVPVKDQRSFLDALARLPTTLRVRGVLVGDGPLREPLQERARELGLADRVAFLGSRSDVEHLMSGFDVFVLSSTSEGLSNTIQEAMACGRPVVATRVGGAAELVEAGRTGLLVPPSDVDALADAIGQLAGDACRRARFGASGRVRAESTFSLDAMVTAYRAMYLRLAGAQGERRDDHQ